MVVARASGTLIASSLEQNKCGTLKLRPAGGGSPGTGGHGGTASHGTFTWGGGTPMKGVAPPLEIHRKKDGQLVPDMGRDPHQVPNQVFFMGYPTLERYRQSGGDGDPLLPRI